MTIFIRGGTIVNASGPIEADVLVDGEVVAGLCARGSTLSSDWAASATRVIDATGQFVIPGGIDGHTHMEMPFGGTSSVDTFATGTKAAAFGGTTTIVDFVMQTRGESLRAGLDAWHAKAEGQCAIDYAFHMAVSDVNPSTLAEMNALIKEGVTSFKLFMAYPGVFYSDDGQILRAMQQAASNGSMIMMHAENGIAIDVLVAQALERGETAPKYHGLTRPSILEAEATHRAIQLARVAGAPLYIVHLSAVEALDEVGLARGRGQNVFAETCPQYIFLSEDDTARDGFEGAKYVCSPPLRPRSFQPELWRGLRTDDLSVVATDHCPFCFKDQKELGVGNFSKIPNGLPGVEDRVSLMYQGVETGEISLARWVEVTSTTPARMFGLFPKKGIIAPGADADLVLFDPRVLREISSSTHHMNVDYSAYEGQKVKGQVKTVLLRGRVIIENDQFVGRAGAGAFVPRGLNGFLR